MTPCALQWPTASAKRTVPRTWSTQYDAVKSVTGSPVSVETIGMRGVPYVNSLAAVANSASIGSMSAEWKA
ncbi:hypothetical protein GCM10010431_56280 [Streptomyces kunmingensis]